MSDRAREPVEVPPHVLEVLVSFAETHGWGDGYADLYFAVRNAKLALGLEDVEPSFGWRESWSDQHPMPDEEGGDAR